MPVVFVSVWDRRASGYVRGDTCEEVIKGAMEKLGVQEMCKLYLDSKGVDAGAQMDEDDIFLELVQDAKSSGQKISFFISPEDKKQIYLQGPQTPQASVAEVRPVTQIPSTPTSRPRDDRCNSSRPLICLDFIRENLKGLKEKCERRNSSTDLVKAKDQVAKVIAKEVVQHIIRNVKNDFSREIATFYCDYVLSCDDGEYSNVFEQQVGNTVLTNGREWFLSKIYNGLNYLKPKEAKKPKARKDTTDPTFEMKRRRIAKDYGCQRYAPALPMGETADSQIQKMNRLRELHESQDWGQAAENLFHQTYPSQRNDITSTKPITALATEFMQRWPIFHKGKFLLMHGELLTGVSVTKYNELLGQRSTDIVRFMRNFWADEELQLRSTRRKRSAKAGSMIQLLAEMDAACTAERGQSSKCAAVFQLICGFMGEDFGMMAAVVPPMASSEEVKAALAVANENPIILIQGDGIFDENAVYSVYILDTVKIDAQDFLQASLIWFLAFYVFDFCYTREVQHTLEFIQRFFLGINPPTGDRRMTPKRNVSVVSDRVVSLVEALRLSASPWVVPEEEEEDD